MRTEVKWTIGVKHATDGGKARRFEQEQKGRLYNRIRRYTNYNHSVYNIM